jgi:hypothetical protein
VPAQLTFPRPRLQVPRRNEMASYAADKASTSSGSGEGKHHRGFALDEKRRAALAEIDSAKFS